MNRICLFAGGAAWLALCGCTLLKPQPAGDVLERVEPDLGGEYYLYKPTNYSESRRWPLLVLCHSSPWQSPKSVVADWAPLAEEKGLLLLAPKLRSTGAWPAKISKQLAIQEDDEEATLGRSALGNEAFGESRAADPLAVEQWNSPDFVEDLSIAIQAAEGGFGLIEPKG